MSSAQPVKLPRGSAARVIFCFAYGDAFSGVIHDSALHASAKPPTGGRDHAFRRREWHDELIGRLGPLPYAEVPRRSFIDRLSPPEGKIREAMVAVEGLPADPRLTEALNLLGAAWQKVADYVDEQIEGVECP